MQKKTFFGGGGGGGILALNTFLMHYSLFAHAYLICQIF